MKSKDLIKYKIKKRSWCIELRYQSAELTLVTEPNSMERHYADLFKKWSLSNIDNKFIEKEIILNDV